MKKLVVFLLLGFASFALIAGSSAYAADELVDLYPYDQQACLEGTNECTQTKLGSSHWTTEFAGHRYHFARGAVRYVKDFEDDDSNGFINLAEMGGLTWNAFAGLIINDTTSKVILETASARTDLTAVVHRMYSYFDETGKLTMFEDHIGTYYIFNDGTPVAPDWRLATPVEAQAFVSAADDAKPVTTRFTHIRMKLDATDSNGYVIEPLKYLTWTNADVDVATAPVEDWSTIINGDGGVTFNGNPNFVVIPAGWTVITWGTKDRDNSSAAATLYIHHMPSFMLDAAVTPLVTKYADQPAAFAGITALDDDAVTAGTNVVVDYNGTFALDPDAVSASWVKMFDAAGKIINKTEKLDFSVAISQNDVVLETINFVYNATTDKYTASAAVTKVDASVFGGAYKATWSTTTPKDAVTNATADIVIGVMPPRFAGVKDRFIDQGEVIDLMKGITADDGYLNDTTDDIIVTYPAGFNPYYPLPGEYKIDLEFTHHVHFDGIKPTVNIKGEIIVLDPAKDINQAVATNVHTKPMVFTDATIFRGIATAYGSLIVKVAADGTMKESYDRYNWQHTTSTGMVVGDETQFNAWKAAMTLEPGEFIVTAHGSVEAPRLRPANLPFGSSVVLSLESKPDFDYDIVTKASYKVTVDDKTAPVAIVLSKNYSFYAGDFANVNESILANVIAYDMTDAQEDLAIYVSNAGGINIFLPGTYTVEVTVEDVAGLTSIVEFDVTVMKANKVVTPLTQAEIQALIDAKVLTEAQVKALIAANVLNEAAIQALIDAAVVEPDTGCGSAINGGSAIFITFSLVLGASLVFIFRKRR